MVAREFLRPGPIAQGHERQHGASLAFRRPVNSQRLKLVTAPQQVREPRAGVSLRDPQLGSRDQKLIQVQPIVVDSDFLALLGERTGLVELTALDVDDHRHRQQLQEREMLVVDQPQAGLRLNLGVVERSLRQRDRRPLAVHQTLPGRMPLAPGPLQPEIEQSQRELVAFADPQRMHGEKSRLGGIRGRQAHRQRGLHLIGRGPR